MLSTLGPILVMFAVALMAAIASIAAMPSLPRRWAAGPVLLGCCAGATVVHALLPGRSLGLCAVAGAILVVACAGYVGLRPMLSGPGAVVWVVYLTFGATATTWGVLFLHSLSLSRATTVLLWATVGVAAITLPSAVVTTREGWEPLLRRAWRRPRDPLTVLPARLPRVSIHVPCYAEPPQVVIATLDRLAALDYPNFEVLVVDNNTLDPELWQPVRSHCSALGDRFRFLHVEGLTGAKAGALNWALPHTDPAAELIAVVDADYQVEPEWLRCTVGYFDDNPLMGFVQCPHAYRDYEHSRFGRWANWEYSVFFQAGMVSLNEHNAGLTVGTMSVIRRQALEEVGGWAEWCLTEDSELAVRIHAAGYDSVYLTERYGRGLIPETFRAYRRQRFRWTYGPVQEFRRHWRLFLPLRLGGTPSRLTRAQKLHHANHGIDVICVGLRALTIPLGAGSAASMLLHHERIPVPVELWAASTSVLITSLLIRYLVYTRVVGAALLQAIGGTVAFAALSLVIATASLRASAGRPATWQRTGKFEAIGSGLRVLRQVKTETVAAAACVLGAVMLLVLAPLGGVVTMLAIALAIQAASYSAATAVAVIADRSLPQREPRRAVHRRPQPTVPGYRPRPRPESPARAAVGGRRAGLAFLAVFVGAAVVFLAVSFALGLTPILQQTRTHDGVLDSAGQRHITRPLTSSPAAAVGSKPAPFHDRTANTDSATTPPRSGSKSAATPPAGLLTPTTISSSVAAAAPVPAATSTSRGSPATLPRTTPAGVPPTRPGSTTPTDHRPTATPTPTTSYGRH